MDIFMYDLFLISSKYNSYNMINGDIIIRLFSYNSAKIIYNNNINLVLNIYFFK